MHQHSVSTSSSSAEANLDHNHDPETRLIAAHRRNIAESVNAEKELLQMVKDDIATAQARKLLERNTGKSFAWSIGKKT
jgi:hypothetical protein